MVPVLEQFSIIIIGAWNPSIFSPEWIKENLLGGEEADIEIAFAIDDATAPRKISFNNLNLFPGRKQLRISPSEATKEGLDSCAKIAVKIMTFLKHTPVRDFGINFGFDEANPPAKLESIFLTEEKGKIFESYNVKDEILTRGFKKPDNDKYLINLALRARPDGNFNLKYNFHYTNLGLQGCFNILSDNASNKNYEEAIEISQSIYDLNIEQIN